MRGWGKGLGADLSEESDWLLAHGMCVANVRLDDLSKGLLHSLQGTNTTYSYCYTSEEWREPPLHLNNLDITLSHRPNI